MKIKFGVYMIQKLGTLYKNNEIDLDGRMATVIDLDLSQVEFLLVNYSVGDKKYTSDVVISNIETGEVIIPFKSDVLQIGTNELELVAHMNNGDVKVSQTCTYCVKEGIGPTEIIEWPESNSGILSEYATKEYVNDAISNIDIPEVDLSDYVTKDEMPDMNNYATTEYVDEQISNIEVPDIDLSDYVTRDEMPDMNNYATTEYVDNCVEQFEEMIAVAESFQERLNELEAKSSIHITEQRFNEEIDRLDSTLVACVTKNYVDNQIGEIGTILDSINGEEV